jgi:hypothetical protein
MNDHIAAEDLAAYVDGVLAGEEKAGLESHLSHCRECLETLAEIVEIRESRVKVPAEFLGRALKVPAEGPEGSRRGSALRERVGRAPAVLPMRLAFGVAAVFLVVVIAGYFFLGRSRVETAKVDGKKMPQQTVVVKDHPFPTKSEKPPIEAVEHPARALEEKALESQAEAVSGFQREKKFATRAAKPARRAVPKPGWTAEPVATPANEERLQLADEADMERPREEGAVGGVEAPLGKDKAREMKLATAPAPPAARGEELRQSDESSLHKETAPGRAKGAAMEEGIPRRYRFSGSSAAAAVQFLLAATGRAAAPMAISISTLNPQPTFHFEGDVSLADLRDPVLLNEWHWFPEGLALGLEIAADGAVTKVVTLGRWDGQTAARAREAGAKLRFSASGEKKRRAVLRVRRASLN